MAASSTATVPPPSQAKSAAPASGAISRMPSLTVCRAALASGSSCSGSISVSSADWAEPNTTPTPPYTMVTA